MQTAWHCERRSAWQTRLHRALSNKVHIHYIHRVWAMSTMRDARERLRDRPHVSMHERLCPNHVVLVHIYVESFMPFSPMYIALLSKRKCGRG